MRKEFTIAIEKLAIEDEKIVFMTGDLGYNAFENMQKCLGERFINAGVAEQSMISMAAGMAYSGYKVFCYSIAPFIVYRCLEQFRNDVCLHDLPVFLVGNGGGYGYGIMGSTHHALEDIACMSGMQNAQCFVPAFNDEVETVLKKILSNNRPSYLRLNNSTQAPVGYNSTSCFNAVIKSTDPKGTIVALGAVVGNVIQALSGRNVEGRFNVFTAISFPLELSDELIQSIVLSKYVLIVEEHVSVGGLAQQLSIQLLKRNIASGKIISLCATGYQNGLYGDQQYHQKQSGLDALNIEQVISAML